MPPKGTKHTQKSKEKMSVSAKERLKNPLNNNFYGKTHTLEVKNRLSKFRMGKTLEEVGREFNVTRERIRQIEAKAIRKLKHPSKSKLIKEFYKG